MRFLIGAIAIGVGVFSFVNTASLSPKFDYASATLEERQGWLDDHADSLQSWSRFFLPSGRGPSALNFYMDDVVARANRNEIEMMIRVKVPYGAEVGIMPPDQPLTKLCTKYVKTALYKNQIRLVSTFNKDGGGQLMKIIASPSRCDQRLADAG